MGAARLTRRVAIAAALVVMASAGLAGTPVGAPVSVTIHANRPGPVMQRQVFGQFAEHLGRGIYGGIWVGEGSPIPNDHGYRLDVLAALREMKVPVVRWPGGCFADWYRWRDGAGPRADRPVTINANWGYVTDDNSFGTQEFMGLAERIGAEVYISGNVGSAPPSELAEWMEYMTFPGASTLAKKRAADGHPEPWKVPYLGLGNELWGCGANLRAEAAADLTNRYATFAKSSSGPMLKIASGPSDTDYAWTDAMMRIAGKQIDGLSLHYYTFPGDWAKKGQATGFTRAEWTRTLSRTMAMDSYIAGHAAVMDKYDPEKRKWLVVDEWGTWYDPAPGKDMGVLAQQNTVRDALVAAVNLNIFARHADRVKMAAISQMVNVLQAMLLTDGAKMVRTPSYWAFYLYQPWQDAVVLPLDLDTPDYHQGDDSIPVLSASAVRGKDGRVHVALANLDPDAAHPVTVALPGMVAHVAKGQVLSGATMDAHNDFDHPDAVRPTPFTGARAGKDGVTLTLPARSLIVLDID